MIDPFKKLLRLTAFLVVFIPSRGWCFGVVENNSSSNSVTANSGTSTGTTSDTSTSTGSSHFPSMSFYQGTLGSTTSQSSSTDPIVNNGVSTAISASSPTGSQTDTSLHFLSADWKLGNMTSSQNNFASQATSVSTSTETTAAQITSTASPVSSAPSLGQPATATSVKKDSNIRRVLVS